MGTIDFRSDRHKHPLDREDSAYDNDPLKRLEDAKDLYSLNPKIRVISNKSLTPSPDRLSIDIQKKELHNFLTRCLRLYKRENFKTTSLTMNARVNVYRMLHNISSNRYPDVGLTQLGIRLLGAFVNKIRDAKVSEQ